ncbi:phosphatase PAP2 family protein [Anaerosalibacter sp. Marseille-P3206]|uniref:phosphatase PAP2 family protein n=1 Tax=Anaerosalibacter sp. Marseille-P3206 TaxID=1871005 RepID=UPI000987C4C2|nr:phosphatase PAP2 family protein [Anaerosalibacter sp. Marseille-P3206]
MKGKKRTLFIVFLLLIIFLIFAFLAKNKESGIWIDEAVMESIHKNITPMKTTFMKAVTFFGSTYFLIIAGLAILIFSIRYRHRENIVPLILSTVGCSLLNTTLKHIVTRTRPINYFLIKQGGYSFPSGHSMISMCFYTTMTYLFTKNIKDKSKKILIWLGNFIIIGLIGYSRMYLGVHWFSDVLSGYIMGFLFFLFIIYLYNKNYQYK